jgi:NlpC/P60 family putative phage cell wall peptidase
MANGEWRVATPLATHHSPFALAKDMQIAPDHIIAATRGWLGTPYAHQASLKGVGCDCLGLIRGVWRDLYGAAPEAVPAYSPDWAEAGLRETLAEAGKRYLLAIGCDEFEGGDVLLFRWRPHLPAKHLGIATSKTTMIHAQSGAAVSEVAITPWWRRHLAYAFRFPVVSDQ